VLAELSEVTKGVEIIFEDEYGKRVESNDDSEGGIYLSKDSLITILDLRWSFNGVKILNQLYLEKRNDAMEAQNVPLYRCYVNVFEQAVEDRLQENCQALLELFGIKEEIVPDSQELHFQDETEFVWILNVQDYLNAEVPEMLTYELAENIYEEMKGISAKIWEQVSITNNLISISFVG